MTRLQREVTEEVIGTFERGLATIVDAIQREMIRRQAQPELWRRFHQRMYERLPRFRWIARLHHRRMARRYEAFVYAGSVAAVERCLHAV